MFSSTPESDVIDTREVIGIRDIFLVPEMLLKVGPLGLGNQCEWSNQNSAGICRGPARMLFWHNGGSVFGEHLGETQ